MRVCVYYLYLLFIDSQVVVVVELEEERWARLIDLLIYAGVYVYV